MKTDALSLIERLEKNRSLTPSEYEALLLAQSEETAALLREKANKARERVYGKRVFVRALIEITNICKNDCLYCGVRASNDAICRFRLTEDEIFSCAERAHRAGFRTFVLQGGEDAYFSDERLTSLILRLKDAFPDSAVTLSLGERSRESYTALRAAGADRYLLRHETANEKHYSLLHPAEMTLSSRLRALSDLKDSGFQVGAGFMVGSPYQDAGHLAEDLKFIETFRPAMCGIGPFLPHSETPFGTFPAGDSELCLYLLSILRLIDPALLLPATTALATASEDGRCRGILAGANVVMPNFSPETARQNYTLYDGKKNSGTEGGEGLTLLKEQIEAIGFSLDFSRGDYAEKG